MEWEFDNIVIYKKRRKIGIIIMSISFLIIVICLTILGLISNYQNYIAQKIICYIVAILCGWIDIFFLFDVVLKNHYFVKKVKALSVANKKEIAGSITSNCKIVTTSKYEKAYVIELRDDEEKKYSLLFSLELGQCPFQLEKKYIITTANNWIIDYKDGSQ